jgi:MerR family transcriptional regulator, heat shock protein HspR
VTADETGVDRLDDQDFPAVTMGQAAQLLGVRPAFLRSLDAAGVLEPQRSDGGHRRYSRRQLALAARLRELFDEGMTLEAATRIVALQDELSLTREQLTAARDELGVSQARELDAARDQLAVARARVADLEARSAESPRADPTPNP